MQFHSWLDALRHRVSGRKPRRAAARRDRPVEALEQRTLLTVSSLLINGELNILSDGSDSITVRANPVDGTSLQVLENGVASTTVGGIPVTAISSIRIRGGSGPNLIDLSAVDSSVFVNLTSVSINGGDGNDTILGTANRNDTINGGDGHDSIVGGSGANLIDSGDGHDTVMGGGGNDTIDSGDGNDLVLGGAGSDTIRAGDGNDTVSGESGDDTIDGGNGQDVLNGNDGNDSLTAGTGEDIAMGDSGNDTITGGAGNDTLGGGDGDDRIDGNSQNDVISGDAGNDTVDAGGGRDLVTGGDGDDILNGSSGVDRLDGGPGNDSVLGGAGDDLIDGGTGDDTLVGNSGADTLRGGDGVDSLLGGAGSDRLEADMDTVAPPPSSQQARLWALPVDGTNQFVELDPVNGNELFRFAAPEAFSGLNDGLAFNGTHLFYLNGGGTDMLYQIDPATQLVIDADPITVGSGRYDGVAVVGGLVYILDINAIDIHVFDPVSDTIVNTLDINAINPTVSQLSGGLAGIAGPDRLIATEAGGRRVLEIDPLTGVITTAFVPGTSSMGQYFGAAVINGQIILGSGTQASYDVFSRQGLFLGNVPLPYNVSALGGDDIGTLPIIPGQTPQNTFNIELRFSGLFTQQQQDLFQAAADRWEEIIVGDIPDVFVPGVGQVDDIVIDLQSFTLDGPGGVLGQTGLIAARIGTFLPSAAFVQFDTADLNSLESSGQLLNVAIHEMAHALGFGTIWENLGLTSGVGGADPRFLGTRSVQEFNLRFGTNQTSVPLENTGGAGTANVHWRESILTNELMTGFLNPGVNPITRLTVAQFADIGYQVDFTAADSLNLTSFSALNSVNDPRLRDASGNLMGQFVPLGTSNTGISSTSTQSGTNPIDQALQAALNSGSTSTGTINGYTKVLNTSPMMVVPGLAPSKAQSMTPQQMIQFAAALTTKPTGSTSSSVVSLAVPELEPNNTAITALNIDNLGFSLDFDANIGDTSTNTSLTLPHISIQGTGDGTYDFYSFTVTNAGDRGIFDIDFGDGLSAGFDSEIFLFDPSGNVFTNPLTGLPTVNDDSSTTVGAGGSTSGLDSYLEVIFPAPGVYVIGVAQFNSSAIAGGITGPTVPIGADYILQVSIQNHAVGGGTAPTPTAPRVFGDVLKGGTGNGKGKGDLFFGSPGDDLIVGSNENDTINAGDGMDSIFAGAGNDLIDAGGGNDIIRGNSGADTINGGLGDDNIFWGDGDGNDSVMSSDGLDTIGIEGTNGNDTFLVGGTGTTLQITRDRVAPLADQTISIASGTTVVNLNGMKGNDTFMIGSAPEVTGILLRVNGNDGNDTINAEMSNLGGMRVGYDGGQGNDFIMGGTSAESLNGGDGNDTLRGGDGADTIDGGIGDDLLHGQTGNDLIFGGAGLDQIFGGLGNDTVDGGLNSDTIMGDDGDDSLDGGHGNDLVMGEMGADTVLGSDGNDTLEGNNGNDFVSGGSDNDVIKGGGGEDTLRGGDGDDTINGGGDADTINGGDGNDVILGGDGRDLITGGDGNDFVNGEGDADTLLGGDGHDVIAGGGGNDVLLGGDGNDTLNGNSGRDTLAGGEGTDVLSDPSNTAVIDENFMLGQAKLNALQALPPS